MRTFYNYLIHLLSPHKKRENNNENSEDKYYQTCNFNQNQQLSILAEWTNSCNLSCPICPINEKGARRKGHMTIDLWSNILESCLKEKNFVNWVHVLGEPLLWENFFTGMALWKESGLSRLGHISTNGILLNDDNIECIANTGIDFIRICIDTMRKDVYKKIRGSDSHDTLIANIHNFLKKAPNIQCQIQLMKTTINQDENTDVFFREFSARENLSIFVTECMQFGGRNNFTRERNINRDPSACNKIMYEHCPISWDGTVGLCCADLHIRNVLGNYSNGSIRAIYCGHHANTIRNEIISGNLRSAPACKTCSMDHYDYKCELIPSNSSL